MHATDASGGAIAWRPPRRRVKLAEESSMRVAGKSGSAIAISTGGPRRLKKEEAAMLYYTVTEGRANVLDRLNLRDRSTYGLDWMVLPASDARDAIRQWELYKAGTHPRQADLEAEAAQYRAATAGYAPPWEAERDAIAVDAAERLRAVETEQHALREAQADLDVVRQSLRRIVPPRTGTGRRPKRSASAPTKVSADKRGATKSRAPAKRRGRRA
jgi:hypothetical protein